MNDIPIPQNTPVSKALSELTEPQAAAANWREGPLFVLAGPGSGKTRVLTTRIAKLLAESENESFRVLALTFTNKAADEMSARVSLLVPDQERRAFIGTFHSFCMQMLQQHGSHIGINPNFAIYSLPADREDILKTAIRAAGLDEGDVRYLSAIDKLQANLIQSEGCASHYRDSEVGIKIETVYRAYEGTLQKLNALDFGSLVVQAHRLISGAPAVAARYQKSYKYWMFDEFQDTNQGQYKLVRALAGGFRNIFAVADDDQIIYQWNGASYQQIQRFRADYKPDEIQLPTNYRCPPAIVAAANKLVLHNRNRSTNKQPLAAGKTLLKYPPDQNISVVRFSSDEKEAEGIAKGIASSSSENWGETAILARTRSLLEKIQTALSQEGVQAFIAQRRDDFRSAPFQWLEATLRIASRPLDKQAMERLTGAFNRWQGLDIKLDDVLFNAELSHRSQLHEWENSIFEKENVFASSLARLLEEFVRSPSTFRSYVQKVIALLPDEQDLTSDIAEDKAAWEDLYRNINRTIGRDAALEQFLQELSLRSKEPPPKHNAVSLMTIHAAKGKEFDHVYVVGLSEEVLPSFQSIKAGEASPEMEEERRNCFVAITRAKEWLGLSYADNYRGWYKKPSRFLQEMGLSLPEQPRS